MRSLAILAVLLLASCGDNTRCTVADTVPFRVYTLYFGRSLAAGQEVSDAQWTAFRDSVVTPALPNGYTISDAVGAWAARGSGRASPISRATVASAAIRLVTRRRCRRQGCGMITRLIMARSWVWQSAKPPTRVRSQHRSMMVNQRFETLAVS